MDSTTVEIIIVVDVSVVGGLVLVGAVGGAGGTQFARENEHSRRCCADGSSSSRGSSVLPARV